MPLEIKQSTLFMQRMFPATTPLPHVDTNLWPNTSIHIPVAALSGLRVAPAKVFCIENGQPAVTQLYQLDLKRIADIDKPMDMDDIRKLLPLIVTECKTKGINHIWYFMEIRKGDEDHVRYYVNGYKS